MNGQAGERHIPQCKNILAKPTMLKRGGGAGAHLSAAAGGASYKAPMPKTPSSAHKSVAAKPASGRR
jgi:hypothetical protein